MASCYSFLGKVLKKTNINSILSYYNYLSNKVTSEFDSEYDILLDFFGYGYFLTAFGALNIKAKVKTTWIHDEKIQWLKPVSIYLKYYDKVFCASKTVKNVFIN